MEWSNSHRQERVHLLDRGREEARNKDAADPAHKRRTTGREAPTLLLGRMSSSYQVKQYHHEDGLWQKKRDCQKRS